MDKKKFSTDQMYALCNKHGFFTSGCNTQYQKFFDICQKGVTLSELTNILWLCSEQSHIQIFSILQGYFDKVGEPTVKCDFCGQATIQKCQYCNTPCCDDCLNQDEFCCTNCYEQHYN